MSILPWVLLQDYRLDTKLTVSVVTSQPQKTSPTQHQKKQRNIILSTHNIKTSPNIKVKNYYPKQNTEA